MEENGTCVRKHLKKNTSNPVDRISDLPDSMIHHIFSFLETKPVIQTCILSSRWRYVWTFSPFLKFNLTRECEVFNDVCHMPTALDKKNRKSFVKFVDSVLINRESVNIHKFSLTSEVALDRGHLFTWINGVLKRNAKILYLKLSPDLLIFDLPSALFTSNVTELTVTVTEGVNGIRLPMSVCSSPRIRSMTLEYLTLPDGNSSRELDFSFPVLVYLSMLSCNDGDIRPQLKRLDMSNEYYFGDSRKINICSPNLEYFKCFGCMYADISFVNLLHLRRADITICRPESEEMESEMYDRCLTKVLKGIYNIDALVVAVETLKDIADTPSTLEMLPTIFCNLRDIIVKDTSNITTNEPVKAMATILSTLPCIQVFVWRRLNTPRISTKDEGLPTQCVLSALKTFEIEYAHGMEEELAFVEYILEAAICLNKLIITTAENRMLPAQFCQKLSVLPRALSIVVISDGTKSAEGNLYSGV